MSLDLVDVVVTVHTEILTWRALDLTASGPRDALTSHTQYATPRLGTRVEGHTDREAIHKTPPPSLMSSFAASVTNET